MTFAARLATLMSEVVKEQKLSTPADPMSDELQRFIDALMKKAAEVKERIP